MEASTLIDPRIVDAVTSVVPVVAHGPLEHGTFQAMEDGRAVTRCRLYRNLDCSEHQATHEFLFPYQPKGRFRIPFTVWIDPEGRQLFRRDGWRKPEEFLFDIRQALEKVPGTKIPKKDYTALVQPLDEGREAFARRQYRVAAERFTLAARAEVAEIRQLAEEGLKQVQKTGSTLVDAARTAVKAGRIRQARPALDLAAREFPSMDCGREAVDLLKALPFPLRMLSLVDVQPVHGGAAVHVRGDGFVVAQIVAPKPDAVGLYERRFEFSLDVKAWEDLAKGAEQPGVFDLREPDSAGAVDKNRPTLALHLWTEKSSVVSRASVDRQPEFDALCAWLTAHAAVASKGTPAWEGPYDADWRPEGSPAR